MDMTDEIGENYLGRYETWFYVVMKNVKVAITS